MIDVDLRRSTPRSQHAIYERLAVISDKVAPSTWCVIGGLMTELVLAERGATSPRTTTDGDIMGHLAVDPDVMAKIESVLIDDLNMTMHPTGDDGVVCRYRDSPDDALFIDVLVPTGTRAANGNPKRLDAPGTTDGQFLATLTERRVTWSDNSEPFVARYPSITGAFYAKAATWMYVIPPPSAEPIKKDKHLLDASALAGAASLTELSADRSKGFRKRIRAVRDAVMTPTPIMAEHFDPQELDNLLDKLNIVLDD